MHLPRADFGCFFFIFIIFISVCSRVTILLILLFNEISQLTGYMLYILCLMICLFVKYIKCNLRGIAATDQKQFVSIIVFVFDKLDHSFTLLIKSQCWDKYFETFFCIVIVSMLD